MQQSGSRGLIRAVSIHPVSSKDPKRTYRAAAIVRPLRYHSRRTSPLLFGDVDAAAARIRKALAAFHTDSGAGIQSGVVMRRDNDVGKTSGKRKTVTKGIASAVVP